MAPQLTDERATPASGSKSQQAYAWIRDRIRRQEFTPGYRLVLATIATDLGMSVVPVREAIRRLEAEGLVSFQRNVGAQVTMIDDGRYRESMQALAVLEGSAIGLAAPHLSADDIRRARDINQLMDSSLERFDPHAFTALNREFHSILFAPCPNARVLELTEAEWGRLGHLRDSTFSFVPGRAPVSVREHEDILRLIENGAPPPEVERAARDHRTATLTAYDQKKHPEQQRRES